MQDVPEMTERERARLQAFARGQASRAALLALSLAGLVGSLVWMALVPERPFSGPWLVAAALFAFWVFLLRDAPRHWLAARRDLHGAEVQSVAGPAFRYRERAPGLIALQRGRLEVDGREFALAPSSLDSVASGVMLQVRFAPASGALLSWTQTDAPRDAGPDAERAVLDVALTPRESQLLALIAEGRSDKEIARALNLSPATVRGYNSDLYAKLGVSNRTQAAALARP